MKRKHERQEAAAAMKAEADKRTPAERLARLDAAGHTAKKERAKLAKLLEKQA
jgi:hypothetical protein